MTTKHAPATEETLVRIDLYERPPGSVLDERELAAALNVSRKTLQYWRQHGRCPRFFRLHSHVRYLVSDVVAWMEQNRG